MYFVKEKEKHLLSKALAKIILVLFDHEEGVMKHKRWLSQVAWVCMLALGLVSGVYGASDNFRGNPNQVRWKFSQEMDTPHIAWAKPLPGAPVNATIIAPALAYRDVAELCQRLSVHVTPVMTESYQQIPMLSQYDAAYPDLGDTPDIGMALVQERLQQPADVMVIGKISWSAFRVTVPAGVGAGNEVVRVYHGSAPAARGAGKSGLWAALHQSRARQRRRRGDESFPAHWRCAAGDRRADESGRHR